ncbi:MAG: CHASE2 domain-containing protein [Patulibacter minatonensis]
MRHRLIALVGALTLALATVAGALGVFAPLERLGVDARFEVRGNQPVDGVAVVALDERTFSSMQVTWPMRRTLHAQMLDRLRQAGVRRIVYDVQFTEPSASESDDLALFDAVERAPGTILATGESDANGGTRVLGGDEQLAEIGARAASSTFPSDSAGVIRRYAEENAGLVSLASAAASAAGRPLPASSYAGDGTALIDFRGPTGTVPTYSFVDVLRGRVDAAKLRGRVVVVGATAPVLQDLHPTSAPGARLMPGPEIQANAIWTALHGNPLRELASWSGVLLSVALGLLGLLAVLRFGPLRGPVLAVALAVAYCAVGVVAFANDAVIPIAAPLVALLATVLAATLLAVAAEIAARVHLTRYSAQLEAEVHARTAALAESQLEVVLRLARAAELRDDDTGEHIDRMSALCAEVARELGWSEPDALLIQHASALHDIGKIGVPDSVLCKPGRLTPEEFDVMREHVVAGAALLTHSDAPVLALAEEICRTHHEKWDGSGYPAGLAGEAIPLSGRIAAVCDVFDALSSERPYKHAWPRHEVLAEIRKCRGGHFDPRVADALLAVIARQDAGVADAEVAPAPLRRLAA